MPRKTRKPNPPLFTSDNLIDKYGDLSNEQNFNQLVYDVCQLVLLNPVPWDGVNLDPRFIKQQCRSQTLFGVFEAIYETMAQAAGAKIWCCKSLANVNYLDQVEGYFKKPKYIYLYRDGRDVAVSFRKAVVGEKHFYHIADNWARAQRLALAHGQRIGSKRFIHISYEAMITDPEATARRLCRFLEIPYRQSMLEFYQSGEAKRAATSSALWGNVNKPVMSDNCSKFIREADKQDVGIFESVAGDVLDALGYDRYIVKPGRELKFSKQLLRQFDQENQQLKAAIRRETDPNDLERRDRQQSFVQGISLRLQNMSH